MMVKLTQNLARGLGPWKEMYHENQAVGTKRAGRASYIRRYRKR